jgi:hypothetical protein
MVGITRFFVGALFHGFEISEIEIKNRPIKDWRVGKSPVHEALLRESVAIGRTMEQGCPEARSRSDESERA